MDVTGLIALIVLGVLALGCVAILGLSHYHVACAANERAAEDARRYRDAMGCIKSLTDAVVTPSHEQTQRIEAEQGGAALLDLERGYKATGTYPRPVIDDIPAPDLSVPMGGNKD